MAGNGATAPWIAVVSAHTIARVHIAHRRAGPEVHRGGEQRGVGVGAHHAVVEDGVRAGVEQPDAALAVRTPTWPSTTLPCSTRDFSA
jgi:hypothetical protein